MTDTELTSAVGTWNVPTASATAPSAERTVSIDQGALLLHDTGERLPLFSGSIQYWRIDPKLWESTLRSIRDLGFQSIETYLPWSVHELEPGVFDFTGPRDVQRFFDVCAANDLRVTARPGPHINSELTNFGYPSWIVEDPRIQARTSGGTPAILPFLPKPFPIIAYCADEFYAEVSRWYDVICPLIERNLYPDGPVVLVQVDNEHSFFFKLTPYDVDYSESAIEHYRSTLAEQYGSISDLNERYGMTFESFAEVEPPRSYPRDGRLASHRDWVIAKERYLTDSLARLATMLRQRGLGRVPFSHNTPGTLAPPYNQVAIEREVDVQGIDFYVHREDYEHLKRSCLQLTGTSRLPFIPEFGAGTWLNYRPILDHDAEGNALTALMHGIRAINYYMLVERERWLGSPIGRRGDLRPEASFYRRLLELVERSRWTELTRRTDVLLLHERDYERQAFAARAVSPPFFLFPPLLGPFAGLGLKEILAESQETPHAYRAFLDGAYAALVDDHQAFALGDSESTLEWLRRYRAIICPSFDSMSVGTQEKLAAYARGGGVLIVGPELPTRDEGDRSCGLLAAELELLHLASTPADVAGLLRGAGVAPPWSIDNPRLDLALHEGGGLTILFVANRSDVRQAGTLTLPGIERMHGLWQEGELAAGVDGFHITLAPREIQVWSSIRC
jgi:beta-galactosidase